MDHIIWFTFQVVTITEKQIRLTLQLGTGTEKQLQNRYGRCNSDSRDDPPWSYFEMLRNYFPTKFGNDMPFRLHPGMIS